MKKIYLTKKGKEEKEKTLKTLIKDDRPKVIQELKAAREQGDLSENADYDAARNHQATIEAQIKNLENILENVVIIEEKKDHSFIRLGSKVKYIDVKTNQEKLITIVGPLEVSIKDVKDIKISNESPLAKALSTHTVGDVVPVRGINKPYTVKIVSIK